MQDPITTPRAFYERVVRPDCGEVFAKPYDVRLVFHACTSLHHLKEWVFQAAITGFTTQAAFNADANARCPELDVIRELANNAKHFPPTSSEPMNVGVSAVSMAYGQGLYGTLVYGNRVEDQVIAKTVSGRTEVMIPIITKALYFWANEFQTNNW